VISVLFGPAQRAFTVTCTTARDENGAAAMMAADASSTPPIPIAHRAEPIQAPLMP
jgi:hypothetical protein